MALSVRLVTPATLAELTAVHAAVVAGHHAPLRCAQSPDQKYPTLEWLVACVNEVPPHHEVAIATDGTALGGLIAVHLSNKRILWECVNSHYGDHLAVVYAFTEWTLERYGVSWGIVENPELRAMMESMHPNITINGDRVEWSPNV